MTSFCFSVYCIVIKWNDKCLVLLSYYDSIPLLFSQLIDKKNEDEEKKRKRKRKHQSNYRFCSVGLIRKIVSINK